MGFVGQNGAGKTTAIKLILNLIRADAGEIKIFGEKHNALDRKLKEQIGVVFDECNFPEYLTAKDIILVMKNIYRSFQVERFDKLLDSLKLPKNKPIKEFSRGMKMKLSIAVALSHGAKLLILDEPTSGLDPIVRDEVLDLFWSLSKTKIAPYLFHPILSAIWRKSPTTLLLSTKARSSSAKTKIGCWRNTVYSSALTTTSSRLIKLKCSVIERTSSA